jgi:hypothetical protein
VPAFDLGDVTLEWGIRVKAFKPPRFVWRVGPVSDSSVTPLRAGRTATKCPPRKVDLIVDLEADKQVAFALQATDEVGNPTEFDGTIVFSVDDPSVVSLTDNGDGTGVAAATGTLGVATLTGTATRASDGATFTGAEAINVVAGLAEAFSLEFDEPTEVTPD